MSPDRTIVDYYEEVTGLSIRKPMIDAITWLIDYYPDVVAYYQGEQVEVAKDTFILYEHATLSINTLAQRLAICNVTPNLDFFNLQEEVSKIIARLKSCKNVAKWVRSSKSGFTISAPTPYTYVLGQGETVQEVAKKVLGSTSGDKLAYDILRANNLYEVDYDNDGGTVINLPQSEVINSYNITSVVDTITNPQVIAGLDLDKTITITGNDLVVLNYKDTANQSLVTLLSLKKGNNAANPDLGYNTSIIGGTRYYLNLPILIRQLQANFATDDYFVSVSIDNIEYKEDNIILNVTVNTLMGDALKQKLTIK